MDLKETGQSEPLFPFVPANGSLWSQPLGPWGNLTSLLDALGGMQKAGGEVNGKQVRDGNRRKESSSGIFILTG